MTKLQYLYSKHSSLGEERSPWGIPLGLFRFIQAFCSQTHQAESMPRASYGPEAKRRATKLLGLILAFANDELEADDRRLDLLRSQIKLHWQSDRQLVVRTTARALVALSDLGESALTTDQVKETLRRLEDFLGILEDNRSSSSGSETWHFTLRLWFSRWQTTENLAKLETVWEDRRSNTTPPKTTTTQTTPPKTNPSNPWPDYCRTSLLAQNISRSTSNPLTLRDGIAFNWDELYVPLGIIARDEEEAIELDPQTFFTQLLQHPGRTAIIGEPGTGKTTLLQKLAWELLNAGKLPIWISLADLQGQSLEAYLLGEWLRLATGKFSIPADLPEELAANIKTGDVWLILDAVDEMGLESSLALSHLARQLRGWLGSAPVILSCRSHVWDSGQNRLEGFTCYSNVDFNQQQTAFIKHWFGHNTTQADSLSQQLASRSSLRDLVKNPLCLALLCRTWSLSEGIATNRSSLYRQFVEALFNWKQDTMPTDLKARLDLSQGLGKLAIAAIQSGKFRLSQGFLQQIWGESLADLLPTALQLGWLKTAPHQAGEPTYAYLHPTFQEYFAAQAIDDWSSLGETWLSQILQPQWRESVGFWLGRSDIPETSKEKLLTQLTQFNDRTGGFYKYRAYFLAATGLSEFPTSKKAKAIAARIIRWRFGWCDGGTWSEMPPTVRAASQTVMALSDRTLMAEALETYVTALHSQSLGRKSTFFALWNSAYSLGKQYSPGNTQAILILRQLIQSVESPYFRVQLCNNLIKINPGNNIAIATLNDLMNDPNLKVQRRAAHCLATIDPNHQTAIATLQSLATDQNADLRKLAIASLDQLAGNPKPQRQKPIREKSPTVIAKEIASWEQKISHLQHPNALIQAASKLGTLVPGHPKAIEILLNLLEHQDLEKPLYRRIGDTLENIITEPQYAPIVKQLHLLRGNDERGKECDRLLWSLTRELDYKTFCQYLEND